MTRETVIPGPVTLTIDDGPSITALEVRYGGDRGFGKGATREAALAALIRQRAHEDFARFSGRFTMTIPPEDAHTLRAVLAPLIVEHQRAKKARDKARRRRRYRLTHRRRT